MLYKISQRRVFPCHLMTRSGLTCYKKCKNIPFSVEHKNELGWPNEVALEAIATADITSMAIVLESHLQLGSAGLTAV